MPDPDAIYSLIHPERRIYTLEHHLCENGDDRYRFSQRCEGDPWTTRSTILVHRRRYMPVGQGPHAVGTSYTAHMLVTHHRPGNTKHGNRVDEHISMEVARHIVGNWAVLAEYPEPLPFPDF